MHKMNHASNLYRVFHRTQVKNHRSRRKRWMQERLAFHSCYFVEIITSQKHGKKRYSPFTSTHCFRGTFLSRFPH